nr:MAG TPA: hypothetical protein [Caudoviricetes sp.]DAP14541.1 MAG TPA: hypothetical protein [Caudoviricetes sp.]
MFPQRVGALLYPCKLCKPTPGKVLFHPRRSQLIAQAYPLHPD